MMKMAQSDVFISGMEGLGTEIGDRKKKNRYIRQRSLVNQRAKKKDNKINNY